MKKDCKAVIIGGVAGAGKTTVGRILAQRTGWPFFDGDDFHPRTNIEKMSSGIPLGDDDRLPWLEKIRSKIKESLLERQNIIVACSSLKKRYRDIIRGNLEGVQFFILDIDYETAFQRISERENHFFKGEILKSQFDVLEISDDVCVVDAAKSPDAVANEILRQIESVF